jgi:predicted AAA+ superfamily ATPase
VPELLSWVQVRVDELQANGLYILTGSNQPALGTAISQSLAGRTTILRLLPLSAEELILHGEAPDRDDCIARGFLPRVRHENPPAYQTYLDYLATYVERDVRQLINVRDLSKFELFLRLLAGRVGQMLNLNGIATEVGMSSTTLENWLSALEASFVVFRLRPWHANIGKRLVKQPRLYFLEPGLASALLQIETPAQASRDPLMGGLFENMVVVEALKAFWNRGLPANLCFYRDSNGNEIDLIIEKNRIPHPVEIKASRTFSPDFLKGIKHFAALGVESGPGAVIYGGEESFDSSGIRVAGFMKASGIFI